jgi:hypothetical protein
LDSRGNGNGNRDNGNGDGDVEREIERYREAAERALDQLEWCIDYLYRVRKPDIARTLSRNRSQIMKRIR